MSEERKADIIYMQADCLYHYSRKFKKTVTEAASDFRKYGIFQFITDYYELLHLYGTEAVLKDVCKRIKEVQNDKVYP